MEQELIYSFPPTSAVLLTEYQYDAWKFNQGTTVEIIVKNQDISWVRTEMKDQPSFSHITVYFSIKNDLIRTL